MINYPTPNIMFKLVRLEDVQTFNARFLHLIKSESTSLIEHHICSNAV